MTFAPSFDKAIVDQEKKHALADLKTQSDNPGSVVSRLFSETLFGKHAYGRGTIGTPASLKALGPKQLAAYHKKLSEQPQVLSIVGDVDPERISRLLEKYVTQRFATRSPLEKKKPVKFPKGRKVLSKVLNKEQTHILVGFPTCDFKSPDRWKLLGLSSLLSGQAGRLFIELRDKMSLCYSVAPTHMEGPDGGYFAVYMGTSPEKAQTAIAGMERELVRLIDEGVPAEEWEKSRTFVTGNHELGKQNFGSQALGLALDELYGFGIDEYFAFEKRMAKVTAKDLQNVARKYLDPRKAPTKITASVGQKAPKAPKKAR